MPVTTLRKLYPNQKDYVIRISGLGEDDVVFLIGIEFAERGHGHVCGIVLRVGASGNALFLFLKRSDDGKKLSVDYDFLAEAPLGRFWKQNSSGVVAQQHHGSAVLRVRLIVEAPVLNLQIKN